MHLQPFSRAAHGRHEMFGELQSLGAWRAREKMLLESHSLVFRHITPQIAFGGFVRIGGTTFKLHKIILDGRSGDSNGSAVLN